MFHISSMCDEDDTATKDAGPQYRARIPDGQSPTLKSVENAADSKVFEEDDADAKLADGPKEIGGPKGPEPTRFGDWERDGRCVDF